MTYDKNELYERSLGIIENNDDIVFMYDVIVELGISTATFYDYFPDKSNDLNKLKEKLIANKSYQKRKLRKKWYDSDNATLNLCAYKLLADDDEHRALSDKQEIKQSNITIGENLANVLGQLNAKG